MAGMVTKQGNKKGGGKTKNMNVVPVKKIAKGARSQAVFPGKTGK